MMPHSTDRLPAPALSAVASDDIAERLQRQLARYHALIFVAMLGSLCLMFFEPSGGPALRALFMLHLGLFILWQPVIERHRVLSRATVMSMLLAVLAATWLLNPWVLLIWNLLLAGIVGGRVLLAGSARLRWSYLLALTSLLIVLLLFAVPEAVPRARVVETVRWTAIVVLPVLLTLTLVLGSRALEAGDSEVLDLVNSMLVMLLLSVLVLGSLAAMLLFQIDYVAALLQSLFAVAGFLLLLAWVWNPHFGFSGLQNLFSRYLLSVGMPAQQWLQTLADLAPREEDPTRFFAAACTDLAQRVVWIRGLEWQLSGIAHGSGVIGRLSGEPAVFRHQDTEVRIYTRYALPPVVIWHINLLTQLLAEIYADKQRAQRLKELSYLRAVHETGARLTHDVKNLLQSLQTLIYAADHAQEDQAEAFRTLMRRQLPAITARLATTLEKLRAPGDGGKGEAVALGDWWDRLRQRYGAETWLQFEAEDVDWSAAIPESAFSAVADNVIANGTDKRSREHGLQQTVRLEPDTEHAGAVTLRICDNGTAVPEQLAANLFGRPLPSDNGLGIGLYQAAQLAGQAGYRLELGENRPGWVCFRLRRESGAPSQPG